MARHLGIRESSVRNFKKEFGNLRNHALEFKDLFSGQAELRNLSPKIHEWMMNESALWAKDLSVDLDRELRRCFGAGLDQLGRRGRQHESGEFEIAIQNQSTGFWWNISCQNDELVTDKWEIDPASASVKLDSPWLTPATLALQDADFLAQVLMMRFSEFLLTSLWAPSHYLPASRSGILQGHKTLASLIVGRASTAWIEPMEVERLPGVITDLIQALLLLDRGGPAPPKISRIVDFLESSVVEGRGRSEETV